MPKIKKDPETGKWLIDCLIKKWNGKYVHLQKRGYATEKLAFEDFPRLEKEMSSKPFDENADINSFNSLVSDYLEYYGTKIKLSSLESSKIVISKHILPRFSGRTIGRVYEKRSLQTFREYVSGLRAKTQRKNIVLRKMREIASFGFDRGRVSLEQLRLSKAMLSSFGNDSFEVPTEKIALMPEEYKKFIGTFKSGERYRVFFELFFYLGARCGEMMGLQWRDYDPTAQEIFIHQQSEYFASRKEWIVSSTKTKSSQRHIKLSPFICSELNDLKKAYGMEDDWFMFFGKTAISKTPIVNQLKRHCVMAGIRIISPHEIRHTVASWLVANCKDMSDLIVVQRWLGHSSLKETLDTYSHYLKGGSEVTSVLGKIQS